jgi:hypothetical protein
MEWKANPSSRRSLRRYDPVQVRGCDLRPVSRPPLGSERQEHTSKAVSEAMNSPPSFLDPGSGRSVDNARQLSELGPTEMQEMEVRA